MKLGLEVDCLGERAGELAAIHVASRPLLPGAASAGAVHAELSVGPVHRAEQVVAELSAAAASGNFDMLSRPDLAKIHGVRSSDDRYQELAAAVDAAGVALEVSTAGLRKPVTEIYPDPRLLQLSDAPITLASDAHKPRQVGEDFDRAIELWRDCGRDTVTVFGARVRRKEPLG